MPTMSKLCICGLNFASEGTEIAIFLYSCSYYSGPSLIQTSNIRLLGLSGLDLCTFCLTPMLHMEQSSLY